MNIPKEFLQYTGLETFVVVDVETTGLNEENDDIIQFAASKFVNKKLVKTLSFFCKPRNDIQKFIQELTNISNEMVENEKPFSERIEEVSDFLEDFPVVGHNISFDLRFLNTHFKKGIKNEVIDTLELSRIFLYYLHDRKLETLVAHFNLQTENAHRADADTENTGYLLLELLKIMLHYDYPIYEQIQKIVAPLVNIPNYHLYHNILDYYKKIGRTEREKFKPGHEMPVNVFGNFSDNEDETADDNEDEQGSFNKSNSQEIEDIFGYNGILSQKLPNYELRIGQLDYSQNVIEAFNKGNYLVGEAETGVGKSLGYLIPAIKWIKANRKNKVSAIVSSKTKNLQDQLFNKEIPFIHENIDEDFNAIILKGRNNYICLTKWNYLLTNIDDYVHFEDRINLLPLLVWLRETNTGDIEENSGFRKKFNVKLWSMICSEPGYCTTKRCADYNGCFLGKIRKLSYHVDLIIINHSLLLSDASNVKSIFPNSPILIIDEAHNLVKSAYQYFAKEISPWAVSQILEKFYKRGKDNYGLLVDISRIVGKRAEWKKDDEEIIISRLSKIETLIINTLEVNIEFYKEFLKYINLNIRPAEQKYLLKERFKPDNYPFQELESYIDYLYNLAEIKKELDTFLIELKNLSVEEQEALKDEYERLINYASELFEVIDNVKFILEPKEANWVYWYEIPKDSKSLNIRINSSPVEVNEEIYNKILKDKYSVIATSATITVSNRFKYFLKTTGFDLVENERLVTKMFQSPFDYESQSSIWVVTYLGKPGNKRHDEKVAELISEINKEFEFGTLVLTTSYYSIMNLIDNMKNPYRSSKIPLIYQIGSASRSALLKRFKDMKSATLIGTESFWEGVDIPGDSLEMLAMLKLPFAVPNEPIVQAISEKIQKEGKNPFMYYSIPEAIIKFKQGFGRLIRSKNDKGIALFLDNRLSFKQYGKYFLESLPTKVNFVKSKEELLDNIRTWKKIQKRRK
ncbi:MAG: helicase C-terminal domain-containing protein [Candidatus Marinimicrobia bacterium]|nr:helicase C-terminal domain-containing protein [Candidatus Neomarinimicrobiota bacterium]